MFFGLASYIEERRKWVDEILDRHPPIPWVSSPRTRKWMPLSCFTSMSTDRGADSISRAPGRHCRRGRFLHTRSANGLREAKEKMTNSRLLGLEESKRELRRPVNEGTEAISPLPESSTQSLRAIAEHIIQRRS
jgi:hypothetical protein